MLKRLLILNTFGFLIFFGELSIFAQTNASALSVVPIEEGTPVEQPRSSRMAPVRNFLRDLEDQAVNGVAIAQCKLAWSYERGANVERNYPKAAALYRKAAEQGNVEAQGNLGLMYYDGRGVGKDYSEALKWLQKAADQGSSTAQYNLGIMYAAGKGVKKDNAAAIKLYLKAADQGDVAAQRTLGLMYATGKGIEKDCVEGYAWLNLSATREDQKSIEARDALEKKMSVEEIAKAQRRTQQLADENPSRNSKR